MKVCLLAPELLPNQGGVGSYSVALARELSKLVDLSIVTILREKGGVTYDREEMEQYFDHRIRIHTISKAGDTFLYNARFQAAVLRELPHFVTQDGYDLIHSQHAHMPDLLYGELHHELPVVRTIHTTIAGQREGIRVAQALGGTLEPSERWQVALEPVLRAAERLTLSRKEHYITVSNWMKRTLEQDGLPPESVDVVYCGVDSDRFRPEARVEGSLAHAPGAPVVLFSGRPTLVKGGVVLAKAIPLILREFPSVEFAFTGGGGEEFLGFLPSSNAWRTHLTFLGYVPFDRLPAVYASADLAVFPTFYENLPSRVLEVLACGVPVVASEVGGIGEAVVSGTAGLLVPPGSPQVLAEAILSILRDPGLRARLGAEARKSVIERFTWSRAASETLASYKRAIDRQTNRTGRA
jgi:glycosyltransferase involved in cell wall biosynthesis